MASATQNSNFWTFSIDLDFVELCSPMFALVFAKNCCTHYVLWQVVLHKLLFNTCKHKFGCAFVSPLKHFHVKKLVIIWLKFTSNIRVLIGNIFSCPASLLSSTIRLNEILLSLIKSFLMSSLRQFINATALVLPQKKFFCCITPFEFIFIVSCHMIRKVKKGIMVDNE